MDLLCLHQKAVNSLGKSSGDIHDKQTHNFLRATRFEYLLHKTQAHKTQAARDEVSSNKDSENPYLRLPSKDTIDRFADPAKVLPVSKRCCPACHALIKYVNKNAEKSILYPGYHENWFTAALPPWLPRKAGMAVIKAAEKKLVERVKNLNSGTPLSDSSTGTSPITSYRVDDFEGIPRRIPIPADWSKDQGEKRKRRKLEEESDAGRSSSPT
ncbi:hypothetical protein GQ44DRAFT_719918 [Phaeosphaeriaceae sp. PMI808]|nr:hypothetical protein GQ44DRAFT_719918 [Phaeosphaeriaceae sp. PMI808]